MNAELGEVEAAGADRTQMVRLLEAVRSFTAERECDAMATTLLRTIVEVFPAVAIELIPSDSDGELSRVRVEHAAAVCLGAAPSPVAEDMREAASRMLERLERSTPYFTHAIVGPGYSLHALLASQGPVGVVAIEHAPGGNVDPAIVDAMLRIYRNFAAVIDDSHRDTLTGLLNRKTFEQSIQTVLEETRAASGSPAHRVEKRREASAHASHWLAVIDIDHFKRINDRFGHLYGDEVLILLARMMLQSFRKADRVYRFGGEEFAVLLSPCAPDDVRAVLDRFRQIVQDHCFPQIGQVTISIGYVAVTVQDIAVTVISHADEALYASKHAGRNRVTGYVDLPHARSCAQPSSVDLF